MTPEPFVLALSTYEAGLQPVSLGSIGTCMKLLGVRHKLVDMSVEALDLNDAEAASAIVVSIPLHDAIASSLAALRYLRSLHPDKPIALAGAHARLNAQPLADRFSCRVLTDLASDLPAFLGHKALSISPEEIGPERDALPPLREYRYPGGLLPGKVIGNVETTIGCKFACAHCTVYTLAKGEVSYRSPQVVMEEIRALVESGANHITFMDAEFMNNGTHGPDLVRRMNREFPTLTFDVISRVDRILRFRNEFVEMAEQGCSFVTTALEFPNDDVLRILRKGYRVRDLGSLAELVAKTPLKINPTLIVFNPWMGLRDIEWGEGYLRDTGMSNIIDPVQYTTRLMITKSSPLLETSALEGVRMVAQEYEYAWEHHDAEVEELYAARVQEAAREGAFQRCCIRC